MTNKPELPPLTAEAFDAMLEKSALFQRMRDDIAGKSSVASVMEAKVDILVIDQKIIRQTSLLEKWL